MSVNGRRSSGSLAKSAQESAGSSSTTDNPPTASGTPALKEEAPAQEVTAQVRHGCFYFLGIRSCSGGGVEERRAPPPVEWGALLLCDSS